MAGATTNDVRVPPVPPRPRTALSLPPSAPSSDQGNLGSLVLSRTQVLLAHGAAAPAESAPRRSPPGCIMYAAGRGTTSCVQRRLGLVPTVRAVLAVRSSQPWTTSCMAGKGKRCPASLPSSWPLSRRPSRRGLGQMSWTGGPVLGRRCGRGKREPYPSTQKNAAGRARRPASRQDLGGLIALERNPYPY